MCDRRSNVQWSTKIEINRMFGKIIDKHQGFK
jgi:hypothetical protein